MEKVVDFLKYAPHKMVFVNFVTLYILLTFWYTYNKFFPNKKSSYTLFLFIFAIVPLVSILRPGSYESGDLTINAAKLMSFYSNLTEGNIIPRWSGELNATYGYPNFLFAYPLPYYIASFFHFTGLSFIGSIKLLLITTYIASGVVMYKWLRLWFGRRYAFAGSILYLYSPYHFIDMHFRVDIGEMLAFVFLPLVFYFIDISFKSKGFVWKFLGGISLSFLILSHQAISLIALPLILGYTYLKSRSVKFNKLYQAFTIPVLGLLYSVYYWLPILVESKYTKQVNWVNTQIEHPKVWEIFFSPYRYGFLFQGPNGELSPVIGYGGLIIIALSIYLICKKVKNKNLIYFSVAGLIYIYLITPLSDIFWNTLPLLKKIEFPFRILSLVIFCLSFLASFTLRNLNKKPLFYIFLLVTIASSILNWGNRKNLPNVTDQLIASELPLLTSRGEGLFPAAPIFVGNDRLWQSEIPKSHIEGVNTNIQIIEEYRTNINHLYIINSYSGGELKENTLFFPGWEVKVDGQIQKINYENENYPGIITFPMAAGVHTVDLNFVDTPIRRYSILVSLIAFMLSGVALQITGYGNYSTLFTLPTASTTSTKATTRTATET